MKEAIRNAFRFTVTKLFHPTLYIVEHDQFLGDFVTRIVKYNFDHDMIRFTNSDGITQLLPFKKFYILERNAKKEAAKSVIPVDEGNYKLVKELQSNGIKLTQYEIQQIIEDGEASEVYQSKRP